ncbi:MAG: U32 family peptidase [Acholeplasmataceae bacterium]|nr:U32 family peptidase [Acholeplasmataceae bacterium]
MSLMELLAPAGNKASLIGAINAGANAVYLAGKKFGARAFSDNFDEEDLIDSIRYAHLRGVFVYVTVNTLIFDDEVEELLEFTDFLVKNHVDAFIIQDLGIMDLLIKRYPTLEIHASTQMNIHNINQVKFLKELGVKRIVMARETPLSVIRHIKKNVDIEIEVFIHGALCVSYSGNCLMSSMQGGRSGNRGECAQPCRLTYKLIKENQTISDQSYLLSTKDLMTLEYMNELIEAGVDSFKIEGRMRKPEYVIQSVLSYRKAIDNYVNHFQMNFMSEVDRLKRVFNREYTKGYILNEDPKNINNQFRPNHLGVPIGTVINYKDNKATIQLIDSLSINDGYRIIGETDYGNLVSRILIGNKLVKKAEKTDIIQLDLTESVSKGSLVVKTLDSELETDLSGYLNENYKCIGLKGVASVSVNQRFIFELTDGNHFVKVSSENILEKAVQAPVTEEQIIEQLSKLGNTPFFFNSLQVNTDNQSFIPIKTINEIRRSALNEIMLKRLERINHQIILDPDLGDSRFVSSPSGIIVKVIKPEQLEAAIERKISTIYYEDTMHLNQDYDCELLPIIKRIQSQKIDYIKEKSVVNEIGSLYENKYPLIANEFLNITNIYTAHLLSKYHVETVTLSPELSRKNLLAFSKRYQEKFCAIPNLELVVYGHIDLMITKYCPIAKTFKTQTNCHLCEDNQYYLQDRLGQKMPLINDGNCNLRILNAKAINLIDYIDEIKNSGINNLRLDFTVEDKNEVIKIIKNFQNQLSSDRIRLNTKAYTTGRYLG